MTNRNDLVATTAAKNMKSACPNNQSVTRGNLTAPFQEQIFIRQIVSVLRLAYSLEEVLRVCARRKSTAMCQLNA